MCFDYYYFLLVLLLPILLPLLLSLLSILTVLLPQYLHKLLGICYELTKTKTVLSDTNIITTITSIILYGIDDDEANNAEYGYMTKIMRIKCVSNLLKATDTVYRNYYHHYINHHNYHHHN
jgi:hypothetical protein